MRKPDIYIAGPMTGLPEFNYPAFREAERRLRALGHRVLNPVDNEALNPTPGVAQPWAWYMRHAIRMLVAADAVATLPGWHRSRGARLEVSLASHLGLNVATLDRWLDGDKSRGRRCDCGAYALGPARVWRHAGMVHKPSICELS